MSLFSYRSFEGTNAFIFRVFLDLTCRRNYETPSKTHSVTHQNNLIFKYPVPRDPTQLTHTLSVSHPVSQPVSQSASHPVSQSASQPVRQTASQSVNQSVRHSVSQPISQSANQSASQSANQLVSQPISQSAS